MPDNLTNRELFQKLLDVVEKNHEVQKAGAEAVHACKIELSRLTEELDGLKDALHSKLWKLVFFLIVALLAVIGVKLAMPAL